MRDLLSWNISLGRWAGVQVRLHVFFILFAIFLLHASARDHSGWYGLTVLGLVFASVVLHEFAHCSAAWYVGGTADQILIWPFGGLASVQVTHEPKNELLTAVAGPLVNLLLCIAFLPGLLALKIDVLALLQPLRPPTPVAEMTVADAMAFAFWINWVLFLVNVLLPAFPLDGSRMMRSLLWLKFDYRTAVAYVAVLAKVTAAGLWVAAWLVLGGELQFASLPLALLGVLVFFSARQELVDRQADSEADETLLPYDFSQGYTSLDRSTTATRKRSKGPLRQWLDARRAERDLRQRQLEEDEERRADEILARLHEGGMESISPEDRALLTRVSARYRNKLRQP